MPSPFKNTEVIVLSSDDDDHNFAPVVSTPRLPLEPSSSKQQNPKATKRSRSSPSTSSSTSPAKIASESGEARTKSGESLSAGSKKQRIEISDEVPKSSTASSFSSSSTSSSTSSTLFKPLPFPTIQPFYTRPSKDQHRQGDEKRRSKEMIYNGDETAVNFRAIVAGYDVKPAFVRTEVVGKRGRQDIPILVIYNALKPLTSTLAQLKGDYPSFVFHEPKKHTTMGNHAKVLILERQRVDGARYLSIIISSLNPNGPMCSAAENGGFLVDCAELKNPSSSNANNPTHTAFSRNLLAFLESLRIGSSGKAFLQVFSRFDFSGTSECRLVHSLAGKKPIGNQTLPWGSSIDPGGFMSLAKAVRELKVSKKAVGSLSVEAIGSSYGRLTLQFLHDFWAAAQGVDPRARERSLEKGLLVPLDVSKIKVMCMSERDVKKELINDKVPYKRPLERYSEEDRPKLKDKKGRESSKGKDRGGFGGR